jgi:hypothetical protein
MGVVLFALVVTKRNGKQNVNPSPLNFQIKIWDSRFQQEIESLIFLSWSECGFVFISRGTRNTDFFEECTAKEATSLAFNSALFGVLP